MSIKLPSYLTRTVLLRCALVIAALSLLTGLYLASYVGKVLPRVSVGEILVAGKQVNQVAQILHEREELLSDQGIKLLLNDQEEVIPLSSINFTVDEEASAQRAWELGRNGAWYQQLKYWLKAPLLSSRVPALIEYDTELLRSEVAAVASRRNKPRKDVRYEISGEKVTVLTDTEPGSVVNEEELFTQAVNSLKNLTITPQLVVLVTDPPQVDRQHIEESKQQAELILSRPLTLKADQKTLIVSREQIGKWLTSEYENRRLMPGVNESLVSEYVGQLAAQLNAEPKDVRVRVENGQVIEFEAAQTGQVLEEKEATRLITEQLRKRSTELVEADQIVLPFSIKKPLVQSAAELGIREQIGKATTPFTGSPLNRIHNIKNGTSLLSNIIVRPGEEFSTIKTLGSIDASTGYLPELVIKGDRTIPEFGGGLCQVSTTLFRAVLNAGLPVTARRNHSYRVSYYEKDGDGRTIGPGLDATIYSPNPDFKFKNDTANAILILGRVDGTKVTFELYGTKDGRTAQVDGPRTLSTTPPGDPIYTETDTLAPGLTQQLETPHPGGRATATYTVTYADGRVVTESFNSSYRPWPARYLIGKSR